VVGDDPQGDGQGKKERSLRLKRPGGEPAKNIKGNRESLGGKKKKEPVASRRVTIVPEGKKLVGKHPGRSGRLGKMTTSWGGHSYVPKKRNQR